MQGAGESAPAYVSTDKTVSGVQGRVKSASDEPEPLAVLPGSSAEPIDPAPTSLSGERSGSGTSAASEHKERSDLDRRLRHEFSAITYALQVGGAGHPPRLYGEACFAV